MTITIAATDVLYKLHDCSKMVKEARSPELGYFSQSHGDVAASSMVLKDNYVGGGAQMNIKWVPSSSSLPKNECPIRIIFASRSRNNIGTSGYCFTYT
jgi:hypothetical protein